ncbi:BRO family protein, partial [Escherichia coli]
MSTQLVFHNVQFQTVQRDGLLWLSAPQIASALQYADQSSVTRIYARHADEFTNGMTASVKLTDPKGDKQETRIFSLRGAHLIAMFARTPIAKEFRRWVLDILDREAEKSAIPPQPHIQPQFTAEEIILLCYMQLWMEKAQDISKHLYPIMKELNSSYTNKLYDIAFETIYMVTKNRDALLREVTRLDMSSSVIQRAMPML